MNLEDKKSNFYRKTFEKYFETINSHKISRWKQENKTQSKSRFVCECMRVAKPKLKHLKKQSNEWNQK